MHSLESHLYRSPTVKKRIQDEVFAQKLYASLCNMQWKYKGDPELWACTWRYAGGVIADLRNQDEDYLDFYCSGNEGTVDPEIGIVLNEMGWTAVPYEETTP